MSTIENIVKSLAYATEHNQGLHLTHEEVPVLNARLAELEAAQKEALSLLPEADNYNALLAKIIGLLTTEVQK